jgi:hypothetical protein
VSNDSEYRQTQYQLKWSVMMYHLYVSSKKWCLTRISDLASLVHPSI